MFDIGGCSLPGALGGRGSDLSLLVKVRAEAYIGGDDRKQQENRIIHKAISDSDKSCKDGHKWRLLGGKIQDKMHQWNQALGCMSQTLSAQRFREGGTPKCFMEMEACIRL